MTSPTPSDHPNRSTTHSDPVDIAAQAPSRFRTGSKLGRTVYDGDQLIGIMDTPELGAMVVEALNGLPSAPSDTEATPGEECTCGPSPSDGRYDDPACPLHGHLPAAEAPQPRVLWRGETVDPNGQYLEAGLSFIWASPLLDVPPGTRVLVVEDVAGTEATEDDSDDS